jgi:mannose-6-phosphate isomerase class I
LRSSDATSDGDLSFMTKYLDCHESLSVQVHPNRATARYLSKNGLQLQDDFGKEESFYVIQKAPHRRVHLFLVFDRDSLAPIAQDLRPILLNYAGTILASELWQCYNQLAVGLRDCLARECLKEVAQALGMEQTECRTSFLHSFREQKQKDPSFRSLQRVFRYHVEEDGSSNANQEPGSLSLLGKEYLFAAIGIIRFIEEIATYVSDREADRSLQEAAKRFFGVNAGENGRVDQITPTLLRYFRGQEVRQGSWVRVPSGTAHSWQGGGNFLIELAQRSDNTFRIMDFGRELSAATRREMHYLQAMYSLSVDGILDEVSSPRLIFNTEVTRTMSEATPECHSELDCHFLAETNAPTLEAPAWSVLMNPDNPVRLLTDTGAGGLFSELSVGRCRSVVITRPTRIRHVKMHPNDRLLLVSERSERTDLVCISLGLSKLEVALHRIGESPSIAWYQGKRPKPNEMGEGYLDKVIDVICEDLAELLKKTTAGPEESRKLGVKHQKKLCVAVSWPGYIRFKEGEKELHSSGFPKVNVKSFQSSLLGKIRDVVSGTYEVSPESETNPLILNDAFASALGEYRHPLGWLLENKSGMVLNIGSGICAGLSKATMETESQESLRDEDQSTIEACSAVGRWLYFDPNTGNIRLPFRPVAQGRLSHALRDHVFSEQVPDMIGGYLRASTYLSSRGLILRFLTRLPKPKEFFESGPSGWDYAKIEPFLKQRNDDPVGSFVTGCAAIAANPDDFPIHKMIHKINQEAVGEPVGNRLLARKLIVEVAQELAEVLQQVIRMLEQLAPEYADCIGRVVLTGAVGEHFGRISAKPGFFQASRDKPQDDIADEDLLLGVMKRCLTSSGLRQQPDKVRRSEIAVASIREIEGFLHYLAMQS